METNNNKGVLDIFSKMNKKLIVLLILVFLAIVLRGAARIVLIIGLLVYLSAWKLLSGFFKE